MRWGLPAGVAAVLLTAGVAVAVVLSGSSGRSPASADPADPPAPQLTLRVGDAPGRAIPRGFVGMSFEFQAVRTYTGSDPAHINPVLVQLIRNVDPGQAPVLRIGGDSTDDSYLPSPSVTVPPYVAYRLSPSWLATTAALAHQLGARMIMGLDLAANQPALDGAEAAGYVQALGAGSIAALEIGNESNLFGKIRLLHTASGTPYRSRPKSYDAAAFRADFSAVAGAVPALPLAGPALAVGPAPDKGSWRPSIPGLLRSQPRLTTLTIHRYPLRNCYVPPSSVQYPTITHLLSNYATSTLAADLRPWIAVAHAQHRRLRVDELNSVACRGRHGVSDTFASSLWVTDALFSLAAAGVDGVNLHTLPNSAYELFRFSDGGGRWHGHVQPVFYGVQLFAEAAPPGSRLLTIGRTGRSPHLSVWATRAPDGRVRIVLINKDPSGPTTVGLRLPGPARPATVERMRAPSVSARGDVTLGGRSYGAETSTGRLAAPLTRPVARAADGADVVTVPGGSAALVTVG